MILRGGGHKYHARHQLFLPRIILRLSSSTPSSSWKKNAIRLLNIQNGSWASRDWETAREGMRHWKWEQKRSKEGCQLAWSLMDRVFMEKAKRGQHADTLHVDPADILNGLVFVWSEGPDYRISVNEMWKKLESYRINVGLCPLINSYNMMLDVSIKAGLADAHIFAEQVLWKLQREANKKPDRITFGIVLNAWAKSGAPDALDRAEVLFQTMKDLAAQGQEEVLPNQFTINTMIDVCATQPGATARAETLLQESLHPDRLTFNSLLNVWGNSNDPDAPDRCNQTFRHMIHLYKEGNLAVKPDAVCYGTVIAAYAKKGRVKEAESLLLEQINEYEKTGDDALFPNQINFNTLIHAYAKSGESGAPQKAHAFIGKMQKLAKERMDDSLLPDVISFSTVLHAYAKSNDPSAATSAEAILREMIHMHKMGLSKVKPTLHSYSAVLACWAQTRSHHGAARAETILRQMIGRSDSVNEHIRPNTVCFATVIDAIVKSKAKDAPERAEALLSEMEVLSRDAAYDIELNQHCFSSVITAWSQSGRKDAVGRAEALIATMTNMAQRGRPDLTPTIFTYSTLLAVYSNSGNAKKANELLNRICDEFESGTSTMKPVAVAFSTVISAWAKSSDPGMGRNADQVYARMLKVGEHPDVSTFSALISAWGNSRDPRGPQMAEFYLAEAKNYHEAGRKSCKPNTIVYTSVINAWAQTSNPVAVNRVAGLLQEMLEQVASGSDDCRPNTITYNSIITCIAKSDNTEKAVRASKVLAEMEASCIPPDVFTFTAVLRACAFSSSYGFPTRKKAYEIACQMFQRVLNEAQRPNRDTFSFFFQAGKGMGDTKEFEEVYKRCCEQGLQSDPIVLRDLKRSAPHLMNSSCH